MKRITSIGLLLMLAVLSVVLPSEAKGDDFGATVKIIEQFYNVKHKSMPFLARAGMKVAFFEDEDFSSDGRVGAFKSTINSALTGSWSPLVQTVSKNDEQNYIYLREAKEKFHVLVVTIDRRDAVVVQATINPESLAKLMQNPDEMGRAITNEATTNDN